MWSWKIKMGEGRGIEKCKDGLLRFNKSVVLTWIGDARCTWFVNNSHMQQVARWPFSTH